MTIVAQKKQPKRDITAAKDGFVSSTNGKLHLYKSAGGFEGAPNNGNPVRTQKRLELQDDGSGSRIKFAIRGKHYDFYEHGKKICTVSKITWDRLMGDSVFPSEIPALMCKKKEARKTGRPAFFSHHFPFQVEIFDHGAKHGTKDHNF